MISVLYRLTWYLAISFLVVSHPGQRGSLHVSTSINYSKTPPYFWGMSKFAAKFEHAALARLLYRSLLTLSTPLVLDQAKEPTSQSTLAE